MRSSSHAPLSAGTPPPPRRTTAPGARLMLALAGMAGLVACGGGAASGPDTKPQAAPMDATTAAAAGLAASSVAADASNLAPEAAAAAASAAASAASAVAPGDALAQAAAARGLGQGGETPKAKAAATATSTTSTALASGADAATQPTATPTARALAVAAPAVAVAAEAPAYAMSAIAPTPPTAAAAEPAPAPAPAASAKPAGTAAVASILYTAPITISKGGTYTGNWESSNPAVPAVLVTTTEPVVIQNCNIRSLSDGVKSVHSGTQVTLRNCKGLMNTPNIAGKAAGRMLTLYGPRSVIVENNDVTGGLGFYMDGGGKGADLIRIRYNQQSNVDGRHSDGKGGFAATFSIGQFVQLNNVQGIKDGEISWNQVINQPYKSRVEDNINFYLSRGLPTRKFPVHNNYIQGAYPADPLKDGFSGGGIIVDGSAKTAATAAGYITIHSNQVVSTTNYGIAISSGISSEIKNNRVVATGLLPSGHKIAAANVGLYIWDINGDLARGSFADNTASSNDVYWINKNSQRNDAWFPDCAKGGCAVNQSVSAYSLNALSAGATLAPSVQSGAAGLEDVELANWQAKLSAAKARVGVTP